ncbi:MAG: dipeptide epimerase [Candidatus Eisenbacteria bacterium]|uniref:Dipeptide epimerase n=1 Tax=Eiseniibacteriota bacterium TaxID=2212470 RepID=A0A933W4K8_UNCEI|nr:dipeptide epimerase [Candidatus Eisenbacteria bacterium]
MQLRLETLEVNARHPFRIAHGTKQTYRNTLVRIEHDGIEGLGEASPSHYYGETPEMVVEALKTWAPHLGDDPFAFDAIDARLDAVLQGHGAARAAIEMALHDWVGKKLGLPVWKLFGLDPKAVPLSCMTLGMAEPEEMERKLDEILDFPMIKVKLGGPGDVDNLKRIRARYRGKLQVDANTAWTASDAVRVLHEIEPLGIQLVEQPVPRGDLDGLKYVHERSPIPVFADESAHHLSDIGLLAGRVSGVNLKIAKTGGLREMRRMIHAARAHGLQVMIGSMIETSLALSAAAQLAPLVDFLDLDGHWLLEDDPFDGAPRERGVLELGDRPGLGVVRRDGAPAA